MREWTRQNVKGIIDILKSEPIENRPALQTMRIFRDGYAYITNGYLAIRWKFDSELITIDNQDEFIIPVENLIKWYKLASGKDCLNEINILELVDKDNDTMYPDVASLFKNKLKTNKTDTVKMDLNLIQEINKVTNCRNYFGFTLTIYDNALIYGKENKRENIEFLVMGMTT